MNNNLSRAERRRLKRERSKERKREVRRKAESAKHLVTFLVIAILFLVTGVWYFGRAPEPENNEVRIPIMESEHTANTDNVTYNSNPPTSGPHFTDWHKEWKFYETELPTGGLIHNMEHGGVVIFYKPDLPQETKGLLRELTEKNDKMIASANADIPASIALAAWGVYEYFDDFDEIGMEAFYKRNRNRGPENVYP